MTDEELIARLRVQRTTDEMTTEECAGADYEYAYNMVVQDCREAADRIEALVKERFNDALHLIAAQRQAQQAEARADRLEAAIRELRHRWYLGDLEEKDFTAALKGDDHE